MAFDGVPYIIGGGAEVSVDVLRNFGFQALGRSEGVGKPGDLKISATPTNSNQVAWANGSVAMLNRAAGGSDQMYTALNRVGTAEIRSTIASTGSSGGRSDLIVARVEDPQFGWPAYTDPTAQQFGPYVFPRVISGVDPATTLASQLTGSSSPGGAYSTQTMYAVARIDMPANTSVVRPEYIKDLRKVAQPQFKPFRRSWTPSTTGQSGISGGARTWFPGINELVDVPDFATVLHLSVIVSQLRMTGPFQGRIRAEFGWADGSSHVDTLDSGLHWDTGVTRQTVGISGSLAVPAAYRGTKQYVRTGTILNGGMSGKAEADIFTTATVDGLFEEAAA